MYFYCKFGEEALMGVMVRCPPTSKSPKNSTCGVIVINLGPNVYKNNHHSTSVPLYVSDQYMITLSQLTFVLLTNLKTTTWRLCGYRRTTYLAVQPREGFRCHLATKWLYHTQRWDAVRTAGRNAASHQLLQESGTHRTRREALVWWQRTGPSSAPTHI